MARKNPLLFKQDEFAFLHKVYLQEPRRSQIFKSIKEKAGVGLDEKEILFVKKEFEKWKEDNRNKLLWMK